MQELEKKYDDENSKLEREKDHVYRQILDRAKNDPDKLDKILEDMGINEVKK
jgi:flagellar motility protein MotE (MotC chaperone)